MIRDLIAYELAIYELKTTPMSVKIQRTLSSSLGQSMMQILGDALEIKISADSALNLYLGKEMPLPGSKNLVLSNYRSAMDYTYASAKDPYAILSPALLLHLNKLLFSDVFESWEIGRFRSLNDSPDGNFDPWIEKINPQPLEKDPHRYFLDLFQWYNDKKLIIHPLFKISLIVREILIQYPFLSGNFLTAVAVGELLIERSKFSLRGIQILTRAFLKHGDEIITSALSKPQNDNDATIWLEAMLSAIATESIFVRNEAVRLSERKLRASKDELAELNARQLKLIRYFRYHPRVTRKQCIKESGVSTMTAYRDLNDLVKRKMLVKKGGGRSTYYELLQETHELEDKLDKSFPQGNVIKIIRDSDYSAEQATTSTFIPGE